MYIILIGAQGSGKGTQADLLSEALGIPHVSSGDLFRKAQDETIIGALSTDVESPAERHRVHRVDDQIDEDLA